MQMNKYINKKGKDYRVMGNVIFFTICAISMLVLAVKLFLEDRYYAGSGWVILSLIIFSFACLSLVKSNKKIIMRENVQKIQSKQSDIIKNVEMVFSSKDYLRILQIKDALKNHGISCFIFDQHSTVMMSFIQDIEMRVMVLKDDFEKSINIINKILEKES